MKMNSLADAPVIDALYEASQAGCSIDLIVRGICCLRPGVPGLSDNIRVRSIVGRFLEHSRIFSFAHAGAPSGTIYIGSADLMPRNLDRRIETVIEVSDPDLRARLDEVLELNLADDTNAWELDAHGCWERVPAGEGISVHQRLQELALERGRRRRDEGFTSASEAAGSVSRLVTWANTERGDMAKA